MAEAIVDMKDVANGMYMTLKVKRHRQWMLRMRVGIWLMRLATWIMWVNLEIEEAGKEAALLRKLLDHYASGLSCMVGEGLMDEAEYLDAMEVAEEAWALIELS